MIEASPQETTDSAPHGRARGARRLLRVVWPFLLTIVGCVLLGLMSMELMSAGRAYVSGESLWSKGQKNAVLHLGDYALSCNPADFAAYEQALLVPKGDRIARLALSQPQPDRDRAREGFLQGQNHPSDVNGMIMLFLNFGEISLMRQAIRIWSEADALIDELEAAALELRRVVEADCRNERAKQVAMSRLLEINERLTPMQRAFSDTVGEANRWVQQVTGATLMAMALLLTGLGVFGSMRVQRGYLQAERRLAQSEQRYQLAVAGSRQGLWDLDVTEGHLFVSPEVEQLLDMPVGSFGRHRQDFIRRLHPLERDEMLRQINALIAQGRSFETELRVLDGNGEYRWLRAAGRAELGRDGRAKRVLGALHDISARKALEDRLQAQTQSREAAIRELLDLLRGDAPIEGQGDPLEQISHLVTGLVEALRQRGAHLDAIFALSPDGFVSFDTRLQVNHVNESFTRLTGLSESRVLGLHESDLLAELAQQMAPGSRMPRAQDMREPITPDGQMLMPRIELERPAQRVIELQWRQGQDAAIPQVLYLRDVTHETEVERIKSEFLSTAAHELRTPMASIIGFSELLIMRSYPPARQAELLQTVHRQARRMSDIVDELLDLARIEARRGTDFVIEPLDVRDLVGEATRDMAVPAGRPRPTWREPASALQVLADRSKLLQALGNILSNAYKYSPDGGEVVVDVVDGAAETASAHLVGLRVSDAGIGLTPEQLARVGERFYRADTSGRIPGTGLGVSIVQEILRLLGGRLEVQSTYGQGTQVTLWLPRAAQQGEAR